MGIYPSWANKQAKCLNFKQTTDRMGFIFQISNKQRHFVQSVLILITMDRIRNYQEHKL